MYRSPFYTDDEELLRLLRDEYAQRQEILVASVSALLFFVAVIAYSIWS